MCETATLHMDPVHLIFDVATRRLALAGPDLLTDITKAENIEYSRRKDRRRPPRSDKNHLCGECVFISNSSLMRSSAAREPAFVEAVGKKKIVFTGGFQS